MKKGLLLALSVAVMLLTLFSACAQEKTPFTLLVYMTGSDLESQNGAATRDIAEMQRYLPGDGSVRALLIAGGALQWQNGLSSGETAVYEIKTDGLERLRGGEIRNMGESDTLRSFLQYGYEYAPAERYGLILWDHGAGPMMGVCFDEVFQQDGRMDALTLEEVAEALQTSPFAQQKLDFIGFDACLMATVETAYAVSPYAQYMIASQDTEPADGWNYAFLETLGGQTARKMGESIVEAYFEKEGDSLSTVTLSCIDLSKIPDLVSGMDALFGPLSSAVNEHSYAGFAALRTDTKGLGCTSSYEYDLIDLRDLLEVYQAGGAAECTQLLQLFDACIVSSRSNTRFINGLSVYYPYYNKAQYLSGFKAGATGMDFSDGYQAFVAGVSRIWLGDALADWQTQGEVTVEERPDVTRVRMALTQEQAAQFSSAKLHILEYLHGSGYQRLYTTNAVTLTDEGALEAAYAGEGLFVVDDAGELMTTALGYRTNSEGDIVLHAILVKAGEGAGGAVPARLIYRRTEGNELQLVEAVPLTDDPLLEGKAQLQIADFDEMQLVCNLFHLKYDENGALLPDEEWPVSGVMALHTIDLHEKPWRLAFAQAHDSGERYALLEVTDAQQNTVFSELTPIDNPFLRALDVAPQLLTDNEYFTLSLTGAQQSMGVDPLVRILLSCRNKTDRPLILDTTEIAADRVIVRRPRLGENVKITPGEETVYAVSLTDNMLKDAYMTAFSSVTLRLTCGWDYLDAFYDARFELPVAADLTEDIGTLPAWQTAARNTYEGVEIAIGNLWQDAHDLYATARLYNTTDKEIRVDGMTAYVNGVQVTGSLTGGLTGLDLPPDSMIYTRMFLLTGVHEWPSGRKSDSSVLEQLGLHTVRELAFDMFHTDFQRATRVDFPLNTPMTISLKRTEDWLAVYEDGGVRVSVMAVSCDPESRYVNDFLYTCLYVENDTDADVSVQWLNEGLRVNGEEGFLPSSGMTVGARTAQSERIYCVRRDGQTVADFSSLTGTLAVIRPDGSQTQIPLTLRATGPAQMQGSERVYDADKLAVLE